MPLYNYACDHCDSGFELLLKMSQIDDPLTQPCPDCQSVGHIRQIATSANFGDPWRLGHTRPDAGWGEVLDKVKQAHPRGHWKNKKFTPVGGR